MTTVILIGGLLMVAALAVAMIEPRWRLPALAFGLLAIPGNIDDLLPQMVLDPHAVLDATAAVITFADLLLVWAVVLTIREARPLGGTIRHLIALAIALAAIATTVSIVNMAQGVDLPSVVRGIVLFARIPALLYLAGALRSELGDGRLLAYAIVAGGIVLLGNGIYTTISADLGRFTAKTFGRNGFAIALTVVTVVGSALACDLWSKARTGRHRAAALACGIVAAACLFGMSATGTRMALIVSIAAAGAALLLYPRRLDRAAFRGILITSVIAIVIVVASIAMTAAGGRTVSFFTDPETIVGVVTNPGGVPTATEIRTRGQFWALAAQMALARPLTGVGPFQWNVVRYKLEPNGPVVVADSHQSYLQIAAEYGFVTLAAYLVTLGAAALAVVAGIWSRERRATLGWTGIGLVVGSAVIPLAALTNAHIINPRNGPLEWLLIATGLSLVVAAGERLPTRANSAMTTLAGTTPDPPG